MSLEIDVRHRLGRFEIEARFKTEGRLTALFGRSGSGKTSLVGIIAGLIRPRHGRVAVDGAVLVDTERRIFVPRHRRRIGYVFQEGRLFPHLTVRQNLMFGRAFAPKSERRGDLAAVTDLLGIGHLLTRRPGTLSGGEKQRVAIGRALLASPRLLLMDEPLAALDEARKAEILPYLERLRDEVKVPIVYVSHAVSEVARLATTIVVLEDGRVAAIGSTADILRRPDLLAPIGAAERGALVSCRVLSHDDAFGLTRVAADAGTFTLPRIPEPVGTMVRLRIRARDVIVALAPPAGISALNVVPGEVAAIVETAEHTAFVTVACGRDTIAAQITRLSLRDLALAPGRRVHLIVKSLAFDPDTRGGTEPAADP